MELTEIIQMAANNGIWCLLFVWLFITNKKEAEKREDRLSVLIENQAEKLGDIAETLKVMNERMDRVEDRMERERETYYLAEKN